MSTAIRPEISSKKRYYISKHRYYELLHFCRQYFEFSIKIQELEQVLLKASQLSAIEQSDISDRTGNMAVRLDQYKEYMSIINLCAKDADPDLQSYIFEAVTKGTPFTHFEADGIPCCRDTFYDRYRKFFWLLDKKR